MIFDPTKQYGDFMVLTETPSGLDDILYQRAKGMQLEQIALSIPVEYRDTIVFGHGIQVWKNPDTGRAMEVPVAWWKTIPTKGAN